MCCCGCGLYLPFSVPSLGGFRYFGWFGGLVVAALWGGVV